MQKHFNTAGRERIAASILALLGAGSLVWAWVNQPPSQIGLWEILLALIFASAIVVADHHPIHILRGTKVSLVNLPIFLSAVMLTAPLAIAASGVGLCMANLRERAERGLLPRDIVATVGQWMFTVFLATQIMHLTALSQVNELVPDSLLFLCAFVFLFVDFLVFATSQSSILGEPFVPVLKAIIREGIALEVTQYAIAVLGALAARQTMWSLVLLLVPIAITYVAFKNLKETRFETIQILEDMADMVDLRDVYTGGHSKRVAALVGGILRQMDISGPEATIIEIAARLHDIGKIGIPDSILKKPAKLLPEEMATMRTHPAKGAELISKYKDFSRGAKMILYHHERWDGDGYPFGIRANDIPFGARVIAVADSFDAMTSDRTYRNALSTGKAIQILLDGRDTQWDAKVVMALLGFWSTQTAGDALESGTKVGQSGPHPLPDSAISSK